MVDEINPQNKPVKIITRSGDGQTDDIKDQDPEDEGR